MWEGIEERDVSVSGIGTGHLVTIAGFGTILIDGAAMPLITFTSPDRGIFGTWGDDWWVGKDDRNEIFLGKGGDDVLTGGGGDDNLYGEAGDDVLSGGSGINILSGGEGDDVYYVSKDGATTLFDLEGANRVYVTDLDSSSFSWFADTARIELMDLGTGNIFATLGDTGVFDSITFSDGMTVHVSDLINNAPQFFPATNDDDSIDGTSSVTKFFSNLLGGNDSFLGSIFSDVVFGGDGDDVLDGDIGDDSLTGGDGNDRIFGGSGNDSLYDSEGNNILEGGLGDDTYFIGVNGFTTINDVQGDNKIVISSSISDLIFTMNNGTAYLGLRESGADHHFLEISDASSFSSISLADGQVIVPELLGNSSSWFVQLTEGYNEIWADNFRIGLDINLLGGNDNFSGSVYADKVNGGTGNDYLSGGYGDDVLDGGAGDDELYDFQGNNTLIGGAGNDTIYGVYGNNIIIGGAGNDVLNGGYGDDIYIFRPGDGFDIINDAGGNNTLKIEGNISVSELTFLQNGNDLQIHIASGVTINGYFSGAPTVQALEFSGGEIVSLSSLTQNVRQIIAPEAQDDIIWVRAGYIADGNVLMDNGYGVDLDADGAVLNVTPTKIETDAGGLVTLYGNGFFSYMPSAGFIGEDNFSYTLVDGDGGADTATVFLKVEGTSGTPPVAENDNYNSLQNQTVSGNVLINDSDIDDDSLGVIPDDIVTSNGGTVAVLENGDFIYTPIADFIGSDAFDYVLFDGKGGQDIGTVSITVASMNNAPEAKHDQFITNEDSSLTGNLLFENGSGVDTDVDGNPLNVVAGTFATPNGGTVEILDNGHFTYTPAANFNGSDSFEYTLSDGQGGFDTGTASIQVNSVNDAPDVADDSFTVNEDSVLQGSVLTDNGFGVDSDSDNDLLSVIPADIITANGGSVMLLANGDFIYTPAINFSGPDGFEYTLSDGNGGQRTGTVSISVSAVNDGPEAKNDQFVTNEDFPLTGNLLSDNGNGADGDIDGNPLNVVAGAFATLHGGTVEILEDGQFTYTPAANFNGSDSFDYTLSDGQGGSNVATASILVNSVNDAPDAKDDLFTGTENHEIEGNLLTDNGFGADIDLDGNVLRVVQDMVSSAAGGSVILMANGDFVYMPPSGFVGTDTFDYTVTDDLGGSASATVTMTINPALNIDPVAQDDQFETSLLSSITGNVLIDNDHGADSDIDGDTLSVQPAILFTEHGGMVSINADGGFVYTPATGFIGNDRFNYTVLDGQGGQDIGTVTVAVSTQPDQIIGTSGNDVLKGDNHDNTILAMAGNDTLKGKNGADLLVGGEGNDILYGSNGNDILVGGDVLMSQRHFNSNNVVFPNLAERVGLGNLAPPGTPALGVIDGDLTSAAATTATITFLSTGAGYNNSLGVYNIGADGTIQNVELSFTNVKKAAAGSAQTVELPGAPDSDFGFFIIADGARQNNDFKKLDLEHGDLNFYYHFGQPDERLAKITDDGDDLSLVFTHGNKETVIRGDVYHTTERDADPILNADEHTHAVSGFADAGDMTNLRIGFEDLRNTGDADYNDVVFDLSYAPAFTGTTTPDGNDILHGGNGDDLLIGGKGNDTLYGDKGADTFKFLSADDGTDTIKDFRLSQGDKIDIAEVLEDYDPVSDILSQFVEVTQQGCDTVLSVDSDGGGDNFVALAIIQGNTHLDLQAMVSSGNLIV